MGQTELVEAYREGIKRMVDLLDDQTRLCKIYTFAKGLSSVATKEKAAPQNSRPKEKGAAKSSNSILTAE